MIDLVFLAILTGVGTLSSPPAQRSTDSLRAAITARVAQTKGATVAVAFRRLGTTDVREPLESSPAKDQRDALRK